jgi:hypothetical protein
MTAAVPHTLGQADSFGNCVKTVCILAPTAANVAAPTVATDGIQTYPDRSVNANDTGHGYPGQPVRDSTLIAKASTRALLAVDVPANATWNTIIGAVAPLAAGNAVTLAASADGTGTGSFTVSGNAITWHFAATVTKVSDFEAAIASTPAVAALIMVLTPGTTPTYALLSAGDAFAATALVYTTAVVVATLTLWGYHPVLGAWIEIPTNAGTAVTPIALAETDTDVITFNQKFTYLGHFSRLACQLASVGGAGTVVEAWLTCFSDEY